MHIVLYLFHVSSIPEMSFHPPCVHSTNQFQLPFLQWRNVRASLFATMAARYVSSPTDCWL